MKSNKNIKLILVGEGRKVDFIRKFIKNNNLNETVFLAGKHPIEKMASFFEKADVMLITLKKNPIFNLTVPAKLQAYMSAGKPIIAMISGECREIINEAHCGYVSISGDYKSLSQNILKMANSSNEDLKQMSHNSRVYFENNFRMKESITKLENVLTK